MTEEELRSFLDENKAEIQRAVKDKLINQMIEAHRWDISSEISKVVSEFVATEIVPEIKKHLADQKGPILKAALTGANEIGNTLAKSLVEHTAKRLDPDSYDFRKITEALFGR